jgi:hypothetical protein
MPTATLSNHASLLTTFIVHGEAMNKARLLNFLIAAQVKADNGQPYTLEKLTVQLDQLKKDGFIESTSRGYFLKPSVSRILPEIVLTPIKDGVFKSLCETYYKNNPIHKSPGGTFYVRSYEQALGGLRLALLSGKPPGNIHPWVKTVLQRKSSVNAHPYIEIGAEPFNPELFECLHPDTQQEIITYLFLNSVDAQLDPKTLDTLRHWVQQQEGKLDLKEALAMDHILCGRLAEAGSLLDDTHLFPKAMLQLVQGNLSEALVYFETGLKAFRKTSDKRNAVIEGWSGYFYALAMLRSPKHYKQAETFLAQGLKQDLPLADQLIFDAFYFLHQVQAGIAKPEEAAALKTRESSLLLHFFISLIFYWLGSSLLEQEKPHLLKLYQVAQAGHFNWLAAQVAELLSRMGLKEYGQRAQVLRDQGGFDNLVDWFERQENWQRQLSALIHLNGKVPKSASSGSSRLVWLITHSTYRTALEPREQKCDAKGQWSKGRPIALKRLWSDVSKLAYLTSQDQQAIKTIRRVASYYGNEYEINTEKALVALIGHPAIFWEDAPDVRVELLRGEPELLIKKQDNQLTISLFPTITENTEFLLQQETPTRLRVIQVNNEHRRIATILGSSLTVPLEAEQKVMQAIGSVAPLITVQSDIGGHADHIEEVEANGALRALLLPNKNGLRMQLRVRPFGEAGAYYAPGQGSERVIAEIEGKPLQTKRLLSLEAQTMTQVIDACPVLKEAEFAHEEWQLGEPDDCLELLLQLQDQGELLQVSWPEGERFRLAGPRLDASRFNMSIQGERDWFAVQGELQLDENRVIDLQKLLTLIRQSPGRFISLGDNEFLALTEAFQRRLADLAAFSDNHGKNLKVHSLAAFSLEDLAQGLGELNADQAWKTHLKRIKELDTLNPEVPRTLQTELRDYQVDGFRWLSRLAHWGVGACLADDMGLGKTVQLLALLLVRAAEGPALVVAPTSVCTNWVSEMARFAPSLNAILFGSGNREETLSDLKPLDVVIVSYGLLQQEVERFKLVQWQTLILDEAQAIKNSNTLRSDAVMALSAHLRVAATGTPLENHLGELWNLFRFINPGLLGSLKSFNERFAVPIERQQDASVRHRLRRLIQPFILRRTKTQVLSELPSRTEILLKVDPSAEESAFYEALRRSALERLSETEGVPQGQRHIRILTEMMKLRRACCNPMLVAPELGLPSSKLAAFIELLDNLLENGHKVLVFSQFVDHLTLIRVELDKKGVVYQYLDGATPMQVRKKRVDAFQAGEGDVFLISLKAGGTGLNLTAADYVIHMDPWWNPAVEDQASDRAHRMGQLRPVTIYRLVVKHTIEESIVDLHTHKRDLADSLLEGSDVSSGMSSDDMLKLLRDEFK